MRFKIEIDSGGRDLTSEEKAELKGEMPRIGIELKRRFGEVTCPEHGQPETFVAVLDLKDFPAVAFSFKDICCDVYNRALLDAAKA